MSEQRFESMYTQTVVVEVKVNGIRVEHDGYDVGGGDYDWEKRRQVDDEAKRQAFACLRSWIEECPAHVAAVRRGDHVAIVGRMESDEG